MKATTARLLGYVLLVCLVSTAASAQTVWTGPDVTFTKLSFEDPNVVNDLLTPNVTLARGDTRGLYNTVLESVFDDGTYLSPLDTEWSYGSAADFASLTFTTWDSWHGANPQSSIGLDAVVHLITDDIYLDIKILGWDAGRDIPGGGFSYVRSSPTPPVVPTSTPQGIALLALLLLATLTAYLYRRKWAG